MSLFNFKLSTQREREYLTLENIKDNVYKTVSKFIHENQMAPDIIRVVISCTRLQFADIVKRAFYGSVDALYEISEEKYSMYMPTLDVTLTIIPDPMADRGVMSVNTKCENRLIPNIIPDTDSTKTSVNYQSIEPYFNKERLHFIAREFNPDSNEMIIRWQFNSKMLKNSMINLKVSISNSGMQFMETHASDCILSGKEDRVIIRGADPSEHRTTENVIHIDSIKCPDTLLDIRYNYAKRFWEYKVCRDNTIIHGEVCYASDNYKPIEASMTITVEGVGLYIEPIGVPQSIH